MSDSFATVRLECIADLVLDVVWELRDAPRDDIVDEKRKGHDRPLSCGTVNPGAGVVDSISTTYMYDAGIVYIITSYC